MNVSGSNPIAARTPGCRCCAIISPARHFCQIFPTPRRSQAAIALTANWSIWRSARSVDWLTPSSPTYQQMVNTRHWSINHTASFALAQINPRSNCSCDAPNEKHCLQVHPTSHITRSSPYSSSPLCDMVSKYLEHSARSTRRTVQFNCRDACLTDPFRATVQIPGHKKLQQTTRHPASHLPAEIGAFQKQWSQLFS